MEFIKQHLLLVLAVIVVLVGVAWYEFSQSSSPPPVLTTTGTATDTQDAELVSTLLQLQSVTLSGTILSDPGFLSLQDFTTQIVSEPVGRPNPFAPVSSAVTISPATSTPKLSPNLFAPKASAQ